MLEIGTIITELEGYNLGPDGAVVVDVYDGQADLLRFDTEELIEGVELYPDQLHAQEPQQDEPAGPWGYDPEALADNPNQHSIRELPTYWGPRDPNYPSSMTDVSWRPEPYWRRFQQRHYSTEGNKTMQYRPQQVRRADPMPTMDPVPRPMGSTMPPDRRMKRDWGLPRRMRLELWESSKDDVFDTEVLIAHTLDFWQQYRQKRTTYMPGLGDRRSMQLRDWSLMYQAREGLERNEMDLLYRFMVTAQLIPEQEYHEWQDVLDTYQVFRYNRQ